MLRIIGSKASCGLKIEENKIRMRTLLPNPNYNPKQVVINSSDAGHSGLNALWRHDVKSYF